MEKKRKISVRKVLRVFVTVVATSACLVAVLSASGLQEKKILQKVSLHVKNNKQLFLDTNALWNAAIVSNNIEKGVTRLSDINLNKVEKAALKNLWIDQAQAYIDNKNVLHLNVIQRTPAARIFYENGESYYLDTSLRLLPLSEMETYYTIVVTNVPVFSADSMNKRMRGDIVRMVRYIEHDTFWNAQIAQISVDPHFEFELIPVLGTHKIMFGKITDMEVKFNHLYLFYKKVLNNIGWNTYNQIDLRFKDQVVASPAVKWTPSVRNPFGNMNWLKNIMDTAPAATQKATNEKLTVTKKEPADNSTTNTSAPKAKYLYKTDH